MILLYHKFFFLDPCIYCEKYQHFIDVKINKTNLIYISVCRKSGFNNGLRFSEYVYKCIRKTFGNFKLICSWESILNQHLRKMLCESFVLSSFSYCDTIYGPCSKQYDNNRIQLMLNSCMRLIMRIKRYERGLSAKLGELNSLTKTERRNLYSILKL